MQKQAIPGISKLSPQTLKTIAGALAGAAGGGYLGHEVTPHITGYADSPSARRVSAAVDAILGGVVVGTLGAKGRTGFWKGLGIKTPIAALGAVGLGELPPATIAKLEKEREAAKVIGNAAQSVSIPNAVGRMVKSPIARGAGVGAAGAGLAGIISGLSRRKSEAELQKRTGRGGMIGKDILKYIIPAMVAGGVAGSFKKD